MVGDESQPDTSLPPTALSQGPMGRQPRLGQGWSQGCSWTGKELSAACQLIGRVEQGPQTGWESIPLSRLPSQPTQVLGCLLQGGRGLRSELPYGHTTHLEPWHSWGTRRPWRADGWALSENRVVRSLPDNRDPIGTLGKTPTLSSAPEALRWAIPNINRSPGQHGASFRAAPGSVGARPWPPHSLAPISQSQFRRHRFKAAIQ